jgi:uncharacterized protein YndB with AHSA1/START domain
MSAAPTGFRAVSRSVVIAAPPERVFAMLADPRAHVAFDGLSTVKAVIDGPERLYLGARFKVRMHRGTRYVVRNTVVEYEENRRIAWRHFVRHRWRYELAPTTGGTLVTETFDYSTAIAPWLIERLGYPKSNARGIEATLARLRELLSAPPADGDLDGTTSPPATPGAAPA